MNFLEFFINFWKYPFFIAIFFAMIFGPGSIMSHMEANAQYAKNDPSHWITRYGDTIAIFVLLHYFLLIVFGLPYFCYMVL